MSNKPPRYLKETLKWEHKDSDHPSNAIFNSILAVTAVIMSTSHEENFELIITPNETDDKKAGIKWNPLTYQGLAEDINALREQVGTAIEGGTLTLQKVLQGIVVEEVVLEDPTIRGLTFREETNTGSYFFGSFILRFWVEGADYDAYREQTRAKK